MVAAYYNIDVSDDIGLQLNSSFKKSRFYYLFIAHAVTTHPSFLYGTLHFLVLVVFFA